MKVEIIEDSAKATSSLCVDGDPVVTWAKLFEDEYHNSKDLKIYNALDLQAEMLFVLFNDVKKSDLPIEVKAEATVELIVHFDRYTFKEGERDAAIEAVKEGLQNA